MPASSRPFRSRPTSPTLFEEKTRFIRRGAWSAVPFGERPSKDPRFAHFEQDRPRGLPAGLLFDHVKPAILIRHPRGRVEKDLSLVFSLWNEHSIQADVGHDHPVRKVLGKERPQVLVAVAPDLQPA